jgi:hypothetical protein
MHRLYVDSGCQKYLEWSGSGRERECHATSRASSGPVGSPTPDPKGPTPTSRPIHGASTYQRISTSRHGFCLYLPGIGPEAQGHPQTSGGRLDTRIKTRCQPPPDSDATRSRAGLGRTGRKPRANGHSGPRTLSYSFETAQTKPRRGLDHAIASSYGYSGSGRDRASGSAYSVT